MAIHTHTQKWDTLTISPANSWRRYALVFSLSLRTIQSLYTFSIEMLFLFHVWIVTHFSSANIPTWFGISGAFVSVCFFFNSDECAWFDSSHRFVGARKPRIPIPNVTWSLNTSTSAHNFNWKLILPWERKRKLFLRTNPTTKTRVNAIHWKLSRLWLHSNWVQCERECVSEWKKECDWTFFSACWNKIASGTLCTCTTNHDEQRKFRAQFYWLIHECRSNGFCPVYHDAVEDFRTEIPN